MGFQSNFVCTHRTYEMYKQVHRYINLCKIDFLIQNVPSSISKNQAIQKLWISLIPHSRICSLWKKIIIESWLLLGNYELNFWKLDPIVLLPTFHVKYFCGSKILCGYFFVLTMRPKSSWSRPKSPWSRTVFISCSFGVVDDYIYWVLASCLEQTIHTVPKVSLGGNNITRELFSLQWASNLRGLLCLQQMQAYLFMPPETLGCRGIEPMRFWLRIAQWSFNPL